ncbi:DUF1127 domain-containing protein, partial [Mycobacterium tuberculosis]|nr:DUF1127 domain-containing protein [Mycobacterium tuberculosis]
MREAAYEIARQQAGFGESALAGLGQRVMVAVVRWANRRAAAEHLARLDDHLLKDVG